MISQKKAMVIVLIINEFVNFKSTSEPNTTDSITLFLNKLNIIHAIEAEIKSNTIYLNVCICLFIGKCKEKKY